MPDDRTQLPDLGSGYEAQPSQVFKPQRWLWLCPEAGVDAEGHHSSRELWEAVYHDIETELKRQIDAENQHF